VARVKRELAEKLDAEIAADVRHYLAVYGGPDRWQVEVHDGAVRITDAFDRGLEEHPRRIVR